MRACPPTARLNILYCQGARPGAEHQGGLLYSESFISEELEELIISPESAFTKST